MGPLRLAELCDYVLDAVAGGRRCSDLEFRFLCDSESFFKGRQIQSEMPGRAEIVWRSPVLRRARPYCYWTLQSSPACYVELLA